MPQRRLATKSPSPDPDTVLVAGPLSLDGDDTRNDDGGDDLSRPLAASDHDAKVRIWKESPFAAGLTEPTWMDERKRTMQRSGNNKSRIPEDETGCLWISAFFCPFFGATRVGNMVVLRSSQVKIEDTLIDPETGESTVREVLTKPKLDIVVGPYWPMMLCVTYPLIFGVSGWALMSISANQKPVLVVLIWFICTSTLIVALAFTACRDPGILYRTREPLNESWRWNDPADTYRPPGSWYDGDTAVVVEGFDHT